MISNELNVERYRLMLARQGRVQIPGFLQTEAAQRLHDCLLHEVPWTTAERGLPDIVAPAMPEAAQIKAAYERASQGFHFSYDRYLMVNALRDGRDPHLILHAVIEFFNSEPFFEFIRYFTGDSQICMVGGQATRYLPGQFLRQHDDQHAEECRRYAYVLNLTRNWQADWGGLLHFVDDAGQVEHSYMPLWNSLSLFKIPANHYVGMVSPWAKAPRLAITGWWHAK